MVRKSLVVVTVLALWMASVLVASGTTVLAQEGTGAASGAILRFSDIQGHWAEKNIVRALDKGIVSGYEDGTFRPNDSIKAAEFIKLMVGALDLEAGEAGPNWYDRYVTTATEAGFYQDDFSVAELNQPILRKDMARIAGRAAGLTYELHEIEEKQWMWEAAKAGIIHGVGNGEIAPEGTTTRAEAITIVNRVADLKAGKQLPVDKYAISGAEIYWHKTNIITMLPRYFSMPFSSYKKYDDTLLYDQSPDGNYTCWNEQLVVIDLDDPNDPNRKLIPPGTKWLERGTSNRHELPDNAYVLLSIDHLVIKENSAKLDTIRSCRVVINTATVDASEQRKDGVNQITPLSIFDEKGKLVIPGGLVVADSMDRIYVSGFIIPKGNLNFKAYPNLAYYRLGDFYSGVPNIYESRTNKNYDQ